jgi:prepilin-type N-terminal cleavage/methylation domain-containing protein
MTPSFISLRRLHGFTLVELMISIAIFLLLSTILVANYPETITRLTLANTNQNISLLLREAQVRGSAIDSVNSTRGGYGVYVSAASPSNLILFGDTVDLSIERPYGIPIGNGVFETAPLDETVTNVTLPDRYSVRKLCTGTGFPFVCGDVHVPPIESLTITYIRPNPMPVIYVNGTTTVNYSGACLELVSPKAPAVGHVSTVQVFGSGMIVESAGTCDNN